MPPIRPIRHAILYYYQLPLEQGLIIEDETCSLREGFILALSQDDHTIYSECAPLYPLSQETLAQAQQQLTDALHYWLTTGLFNHGDFSYDRLFPSVAYALSVASLELKHQLPKEASYELVPLCHGDPDDLLPKLSSNLSTKKIAKMRIGLHEVIRDAILINLFLEFIPDLHLRLQLEQNWPLSKAENFIQRIPSHFRKRIEFLADPCHTIQESCTFCKQNDIPIAWEQCLLAEPSKRTDISFIGHAHTLIIKPMLWGSIDYIAPLIEQAQQIGVQVILSACYETSLGLTQLARLAHLLTPTSVPDLDTLDYFQSQLEIPWPGVDKPIQPLSECQIIWQSEHR